MTARFYPVRDGPRFVAYSTAEPISGTVQIYVQDFPEAHSKWQVSLDGGIAPVWSRDGKELFFRSPDRSKLISVAVKTAGGIVESGKPTVLFDSAGLGVCDVSLDGKRFLCIVQDRQDHRASTVTVVENWETSLRK